MGKSAVQRYPEHSDSGGELKKMTEKNLVQMMQDLMDLMRKMTENQEKMQSEQQRLGIAMGESGLILANHAETLRKLGAATVRLWHEAKLPVNEAPETPPEVIN